MSTGTAAAGPESSESDTKADLETMIAELVEHADAAGVRDGFSVLAGRVRAGEAFLKDKNCYRHVPPKGGKKSRREDAPSFLAAASIHHIEDGWSYLGRSFGALLRGDYGAATHLGYYAELRAALALMASEGLLNRNTRIYALGANGEVIDHYLGNGTHVLAWRLLDAWSRPDRALSVLGESIEPFGAPFSVWLDAARIPEVGANTAAAASKLLSVWALDLKTFTLDRDIRNQFSYNPTALSCRGTFDADAFVCESWSLLEPSFATLDTHLMRAAIRGVIDLSSPKKTTRQRYLNAYIAEISRVGVTSHSGWEAFLREDHSVGLIVQSLAKPTLTRLEPRGTISRAACLLRVATGAVKRQIRLSTTEPLLEVWAQRVMTERDLGDLGDFETVADLWDDIGEACERMSAGDFDHFEQDAMRRRLETCERVAVWSLAA